MTVLYFSIINVLCGAGGDASFASHSQEAKSDFCTFRVHAIYICICGITGKVKLFRL